MYDVIIYVYENFSPIPESGVRLGRRPVTIATFSMSDARNKALEFASQIDSAFAVEIVDVDAEEDPDANYGLVYSRKAIY